MGGKFYVKNSLFGLVESFESTCVIVFIGISVDYVVHICHQYIHAVEVDREIHWEGFQNLGSMQQDE